MALDFNAAGESSILFGRESPTGNARQKLQRGAYWPFEELAGPPWLDATGNEYTLNATGGGTYANGIVNRAAELADAGNLDGAAFIDPEGCTFFGWTRFSGAIVPGNNERGGLCQIYQTGGPQIFMEAVFGVGRGGFGFLFGLPSGNVGCDVAFPFSGSGPFQIDMGAAPTHDTWWFWCIWYDITTGVCSFQVNNGSIGTTSTAVFPVVGRTITQGHFEGLGLNAGHIADETGIAARVLSVSNRSFLYNAGAARTWPAVSGLL